MSLNKSVDSTKALSLSKSDDEDRMSPTVDSARLSPSVDSASESNESTSRPPLARDKSVKKLVGVTSEGDRFVLPALRSPLEVHHIAHWTSMDWVKYSWSFAHLLLLFTNMPGWCYIVLFLFWRLAYNAGLGYLLHVQSNGQHITRLVRECQHRQPWAYDLARRFLNHDTPQSDDYSFDKMPTAFNAWLFFRRIVDIVLANDLACYVIFCLKYYEPFDSLSLYLVGSHLLGALLVAVAVWGKADAYRVVGTFAWYWGDFFFLVEQNLTFDRVFGVAPHPMYTLGYLFFYGASAITRSYTVFAVSLIGHILQLLFLNIVEEPHIEKTYASFVAHEREKERKREEELYHPAKGWFFQDLVLFTNWNPFRAQDLFTLVFVVWNILVGVTVLPRWLCLVSALFWRAVHTFGLGLVLQWQSERGWWMSAALERGATKRDAFESWKALYNLTTLMTMVSFTVYFVSELSIAEALMQPTTTTIGIVLIALNAWASVSTYEVLGSFGWFYGDFFLDESNAELRYTGIYRYFNNPEVVLGFAGYYGLALVASSWPLAVVAAVSQGCNYLFVKYVEAPHMRRRYGERVRPKAGALATVEEIVKEAATEALEKHQVLNHVVRKASINLEGARRKYEEVKQGLSDPLMRRVKSWHDFNLAAEALSGGDSTRGKSKQS